MTENFTQTITVERSPEEVFDAIGDVRAWWSADVVGETASEGGSFVFEVPGVHRSTMTISESTRPRRIVWDVSDCWISFVADTAEWNGTQVVFDLEPIDRGTRVTFTHQGLTPDLECYDACTGGWTLYVAGSLTALLATGLGDPHRAEEGLKDRERELLDDQASRS